MRAAFCAAEIWGCCSWRDWSCKIVTGFSALDCCSWTVVGSGDASCCTHCCNSEDCDVAPCLNTSRVYHVSEHDTFLGWLSFQVWGIFVCVLIHSFFLKCVLQPCVVVSVFQWREVVNLQLDSWPKIVKDEHFWVRWCQQCCNSGDYDVVPCQYFSRVYDVSVPRTFVYHSIFAKCIHNQCVFYSHWVSVPVKRQKLNKTTKSS